MAHFSVISNDDGPDDDSGTATTGSTVLRYRHAVAPTEVERPGRAARPRRRPADDLPPAILQLPDLALVSETSSDWWTTLGNRVFWIGIILGALLALVLIWNPGKPVPRPLEAAPAWAGSAAVAPPAKTARAPSESHEHATTDSPATHDTDPWPAEARGGFRASADTAPAATTETPGSTRDEHNPHDGVNGQHEPPDDRPNDHDTGPALDEWSRHSNHPPDVRTARGGASRWDGTATDVQPGHAAPTGRILNPLVHE